MLSGHSVRENMSEEFKEVQEAFKTMLAKRETTLKNMANTKDFTAFNELGALNTDKEAIFKHLNARTYSSNVNLWREKIEILEGYIKELDDQGRKILGKNYSSIAEKDLVLKLFKEDLEDSKERYVIGAIEVPWELTPKQRGELGTMLGGLEKNQNSNLRKKWVEALISYEKNYPTELKAREQELNDAQKSTPEGEERNKAIKTAQENLDQYKKNRVTPEERKGLEKDLGELIKQKSDEIKASEKEKSAIKKDPKKKITANDTWQSKTNKEEEATALDKKITEAQKSLKELKQSKRELAKILAAKAKDVPKRAGHLNTINAPAQTAASQPAVQAKSAKQSAPIKTAEEEAKKLATMVSGIKTDKYKGEDQRKGEIKELNKTALKELYDQRKQATKILDTAIKDLKTEYKKTGKPKNLFELRQHRANVALTPKEKAMHIGEGVKHAVSSSKVVTAIKNKLPGKGKGRE